MRSPAYGAFPRNIRNPTLVAMICSVGFHGVLAVLSLLKPAESQPNRLKIVSISLPNAAQTAPGAQKTATLPVPNGVPPINMSNVPQLGELPGTASFALPSGAFLPRSNISAIDLKKLRTADLPQRSFSVAKSLDFSQLGDQGSGSPLQSPANGQANSRGPFTPPPLPRNPAIPNVASGSIQGNSNPGGLYGGQMAPFSSPDGSSIPSSFDPANPNDPGNSTESVGAPPAQASSPETKSSVKKWLQAQSLRYGQQISVQSGRPLIATNAIETCDVKQDGTARVAAIYAPNQTLPLNDAIEIIESASTPELNQAALRAVRKYPIEPASAYQSFTYSVAVPYSESFCQSLQPKTPAASPQPTNTPSPEPTPAAPSKSKLPQPKATTEPSTAPSSTQTQPTVAPTVSPKATTRPSTPSLPNSNASPPKSEPLVRPAEPITPTNAPLPSPDGKATESPKATSTPQTDSSLLGPLPSPSISPSEASPSPSP